MNHDHKKYIARRLGGNFYSPAWLKRKEARAKQVEDRIAFAKLSPEEKRKVRAARAKRRLIDRKK